MSGKQEFLQALQSRLAQGNYANEWVNAITQLYDLIVEWSLIVEKSEPRSYKHSKHMFWIQQVILWSPLSSFLHQLAVDEHLAIRSAAKGELCDRTGLYFSDPEITLISIANMRLIFNPTLNRSAQKELWNKNTLQDAINALRLTNFVPLIPLSQNEIVSR